MTGKRAGLLSALITDDLERRPSRPPDYEAESRALARLTDVLASSPQDLLSELVETLLDLCGADATGISILEPGGLSGVFRWHAIAGSLAPYRNGTVQRHLSACGIVLERDETTLFDRPARYSVDLVELQPPILESLLVPFHADGLPVGTVWALAQHEENRFDAEDARLLTNLSRLAGAGYQMVRALDAATERGNQLESRAVEILESIGDGFYAVDCNWRLTYVNRRAEEWWGHGRDELLGSVLWEIFPGSEETRGYHEHMQAMRDRAPVHFETFSAHLQKWVDVAVYPSTDGGLSTYFRDLTEQREAEAAARSERERREELGRAFIRNAAHQLRTPLAGITAAVEVLQGGAKEAPADRDRFLAHIETLANRMTRLTRALLVLARAQSGVRLQLDPIEIAPILAEVTTGLAVEHGVTIELDCPRLLTALGEPALLHEALAALAENAAKHTHEGRISLRAAATDGRVAIEVTDTGEGIPADEQERVLQPFHRVDEMGDGFGLGLTITAEAVEAMGGELEVAANAPCGVRATIRLPAGRPPP